MVLRRTIITAERRNRRVRGLPGKQPGRASHQAQYKPVLQCNVAIVVTVDRNGQLTSYVLHYRSVVCMIELTIAVIR